MPMDTELDRTQYVCPNPECPDYGKVDAGNIGIHSRADKRLYCTTCKERFSARQGTIFYNLKTEEDKVLLALKLLVERNSIRATSRILDSTQGAVSGWLKRAAEHVDEVNDHLMRDLRPNQLQLDEFWSFVGKKRCAHRSAVS
jgi:transposase-like protein